MTELILWVQCEYFLLFLTNAIRTSGNLLSALSFALFSQRYFFSSQLSLSLLKRENKSKKLLMILNLGQLPITCFNLECSDLLPILLSLMTLKLLLQIFDPNALDLASSILCYASVIVCRTNCACPYLLPECLRKLSNSAIYYSVSFFNSSYSSGVIDSSFLTLSRSFICERNLSKCSLIFFFKPAESILIIIS